MRKSTLVKRVLFLFAILLLPSIGFLILKTGKNNFKHLGFYGPRDVSVNGDTIYHSIPDFNLLNQNGGRVTKKDLEGNIFVADFFFTSCKSICPKMSNNLVRVSEKFKDRPDVKIVSYTVNPERDSVPVLADYSKKYFARPDQWFFLTGPKKELYDLARDGFFMTAMPGDGGPDDFIHSDKMVLVDKEGHIRGYYDGTDSKEIYRLIDEIKVLIAEYKEKEKK